MDSGSLVIVFDISLTVCAPMQPNLIVASLAIRLLLAIVAFVGVLHWFAFAILHQCCFFAKETGMECR